MELGVIMKKIYTFMHAIIISIMVVQGGYAMHRAAAFIKQLAPGMPKHADVKPQQMVPATLWLQCAQGKQLSAADKKNLYVQDCTLAAQNFVMPAHRKNDTTVRLMTYNVHMWTDAHNKRTYDAILKDIETINADVVALQEVIMFDAATIAADFKALGYEHQLFFATHTGKSGFGFGNMFISKYPFAQPPIKQPYAIDTKHKEKRNFINAVLALPNNKKISLYATHLDVWDETEEHRVAEASEIIAHAAYNNITNSCIMGDFNAIRPDDYQYTVGGKKVWD